MVRIVSTQSGVSQNEGDAGDLKDMEADGLVAVAEHVSLFLEQPGEWVSGQASIVHNGRVCSVMQESLNSVGATG